MAAKCAALTELTAGDSAQTLRACLSTDEGTALAREIILLEAVSGTAPAVEPELEPASPESTTPEPEQTSGAQKPKAKRGKRRPAAETQGVLEIEVDGECSGDVCTLGSTESVAFCIAEFGGCRASLASQALADESKHVTLTRDGVN